MGGQWRNEVSGRWDGWIMQEEEEGGGGEVWGNKHAPNKQSGKVDP